MRFLLEHSKTREFLNSHGSKYAICQYFFYEISELDTQQENSIAGLLHTMLYQLLELFPQFMDVVRSFYRQKIHRHHAPGESLPCWSVDTLKEVLMNLKLEGQPSFGRYVCLFVDGFDECRGDRGNHLDFLGSWIQRMAENGLSIKVCLSSRDVPEVRERFETGLSLELHLWTRKDITDFVSDELTKPRRKSITLNIKGHDDVTSQLIRKVVDKAEGVFIWVRLVVADLVSGLEAGEDEEVLEIRLQSLPEELENLYAHIIGEIPCRDLHTTFKYFQLLLRAPGKTCTLTLLQLLLAAQKPEDALECPSDSLSTESSQESLLEKLLCFKEHLKDRCRNLVQIQTRRYGQYRWEPTRQENVTFIHLTFKQYIERRPVKKGIHKRITRWGMPVLPTADSLLMASCLRLLKTQKCYIPYWSDARCSTPSIFKCENEDNHHIVEVDTRVSKSNPEYQDLDENDEVEYTEEICRRAPDNLITKFFNYAWNLEQYFEAAQTPYIDEIDRFLTKVDQRWPSKFYASRTLHEISDMDVLCLAICWKLKCYVKDKLKDNTERNRRQPPLLFYAMNPPGWAHEEADLDLLETLLEAGENPNESFVYNGESRTTWEHTLHHFLRIGTAHPTKNWHKVIQLMLKYHTDPEQKVSTRSGGYTTVLHMLVAQYEKLPDDKRKETKNAILMLLKHGANGESPNSEQLSAFDYAERESTTISGTLINWRKRQNDMSSQSNTKSSTPTAKSSRMHEKTAKQGAASTKRRRSSDGSVIEQTTGSSSTKHHTSPSHEGQQRPHGPLPTRYSKRLKKEDRCPNNSVR
jgi:hypothetical protein